MTIIHTKSTSMYASSSFISAHVKAAAIIKTMIWPTLKERRLRSPSLTVRRRYLKMYPKARFK